MTNRPIEERPGCREHRTPEGIRCVLCEDQLAMFGRAECLPAPVKAWRSVQRINARRRVR